MDLKYLVDDFCSSPLINQPGPSIGSQLQVAMPQQTATAVEPFYPTSFARNLKSAQLDPTALGLPLKRRVDQREHPPSKPFKCNECSKSFAKSRYLSQHMVVHSNIKPHICPICSASFKRLNELDLHGAVHSEVKPFKCQLCPAAFKSIQNLKQHGQTHSTEKPYSCSFCDSCFKRARTLKLHVVKEHSMSRSKNKSEIMYSSSEGIEWRSHDSVSINGQQ
ncbi:hypothetical protein BDR26DRAFT_871317 [Obelidium mucronatum]|nr:hypothetical protein BDR26DRAFT_871317 [Obelidium mucronatum]